ncbi:hypothetical protein PSm6_14960 [Pseudomonas solani]|uniref:HTH cro/C1-type domain-containing protein n=1 Tax=Pseudomonas solani TaxID=2731552 RepID=A0ABM7L688_9PSED|nr:hypothetical protein PSm6_14960 [Pseudomonas solani]
MSPSLPPPGTANAPESQFLGTRIRALRKRRDMTLAELAEQSSLTAGYISQLERNLAYPSIPALFNIARSLGVTIQWFFASEAPTAEADKGYVVRKNSRMSLHYDDGITDELLSPQPSRSLEILHSRFPRAPTAKRATATRAKKRAMCSAVNSSSGSANATSCWVKATASPSPARSPTATATPATRTR